MEKRTVRMSEAEVEALQKSAEKMGYISISYGNLMRLAASNFFGIELPQLERGGLRPGGFEPGNNEIGRKGAKARWGAKKKKLVKKKD